MIGFAGQVEQEKRKAAAKAAAEYRKAKENQGWVGWLMGGAGLVGGGPPPAADEHGLRGDLNQEEYQKLEEIVSEQEAAVKQGECHCCIEQVSDNCKSKTKGLVSCTLSCILMLGRSFWC